MNLSGQKFKKRIPKSGYFKNKSFACIKQSRFNELTINNNENIYEWLIYFLRSTMGRPKPRTTKGKRLAHIRRVCHLGVLARIANSKRKDPGIENGKRTVPNFYFKSIRKSPTYDFPDQLMRHGSLSISDHRRLILIT